MNAPRVSLRTFCLLLFGISVVASIGCPPADQTALNNDSKSMDSKSKRLQESPQESPNQTSTDDPSADSLPSPQEEIDNPTAPPPESPANGAAQVDAPIPTSTNDDTAPRAASIAAPTDEQTSSQEELFAGWEDPDAVLFLTGKQYGYIEPCGCTGLANQKGGLMRRHTLFKQLQARGWDLVPLDGGNQVRRFGMQPVIKFTRTFEILAQLMDYDGIALGPDDLRLDAIELYQTVINYQQGDKNPLLSANVKVLDDLVPTHRVINVGGLKIGVTAVLGDEFHEGIHNPDVEIVSVSEGLKQVLPKLQAESCDLYVLIAYASIEASEEIAKQFPNFDILLTTGGDGEPTREPKAIESEGHTTQMILSGYKGMHVGVVALNKSDSGVSIKYQRVPLDARFEDSEEVKTVFTAYQEQLKTLGLNGLDIRPVAHPSGAEFVGSETCGDCHSIAYDIWKNGVDGNGGPHAHATLSLTEPNERNWVQRHFDPECLSCHVTGWNPQKYFPYESGYLSLEKSSYLTGNGCENCHGPGSKHVAAENGELDLTTEQMLAIKDAIRVTKEEARNNLCMECHDLDNSPDFHVEGAWEKYWPQIEHIGTD